MRYDLSAAMEVCRLIDSSGGAIAGDVLAPALGYSGTNNGAYLSRVASARLFGVVTGRGARFELTDRGHKILAGEEPGASASRREAFLAVPLFRAVVEAAEQGRGTLSDDLARWLVDEFGEVPAKSQTVADRLVSSAAQAGILTRGEAGKYQFTMSLTKFTSVDKPSSTRRVPWVRSVKGSRTRHGEDDTMAENGLWLDEESEGKRKSGSGWRRVGVVGAAAAVLMVVAVPVALVATGSPAKPVADHHVGQHPVIGNGPAEHQVLSALSATTDSGNFNFNYTISSTPASATAPTTTSTTTCTTERVPVPISGGGTSGGGVIQQGTTGGGVIQQGATTVTAGGSSSSPAYASHVSVSPVNGAIVMPNTGKLPPGLKWHTQKFCSGGPMPSPSPLVKGGGVIDTNPMAMVASANIGGGLDVTVRVDGTDVYEGASNDTGLAPLASDTPPAGSSPGGQSLPGFAGITESTLGDREGAAAMLGMASPTGYLDLIQPGISAASRTGTGTVDGVPVTVYKVSNDLNQLVNAPGTTSAESQTISAALTLLKSQGYTGNTVDVSIDAAGYIRQVKSVDAFTDGGTATLQADFSDFGCAGTVLMPGQTGSGTAPSGCTSPDNPSATTNNNNNTTTTTTTTTAAASSTSTTSSTTPSVKESSTTTTSASSTTVPVPIGTMAPPTTAPTPPAVTPNSTP